MNKCSPYRERLADFLNKRLSGQEERELAGHLESCPVCRTQLKEFESLFEVLQKEQTVDLPPDLRSSFPAKVKERMESQKKKRAGFRPGWILAPVAAVVALLLVASLFKLDQNYIAKKESLPEGSLAWLELPADSGQVAQELNLALAELSQEVEESYWEKEDLSTLLADLSEQEFQSLAQEIKAGKF